MRGLKCPVEQNFKGRPRLPHDLNPATCVQVRVKAGQRLWYTRVTHQWSGGGEEGCSDCVEWLEGGLEVLGSFYVSRAPPSLSCRKA